MGVAVVIPCFNYGRYLTEAVESVIAQTLRPDEIVIVDDGSTDDSRDVAQELISAHAAVPIRLMARPHSGSAGATRNAGIETTTAEYVLCLDADDRLDPGFLQACVAALDLNPRAGTPKGGLPSTASAAPRCFAASPGSRSAATTRRSITPTGISGSAASSTAGLASELRARCGTTACTTGCTHAWSTRARRSGPASCSSIRRSIATGSAAGPPGCSTQIRGLCRWGPRSA